MALLEQYKSQDFNENSPLGKISTVIVAGNGIFEHRSSWLGTGIGLVSKYGVPINKKMEEKIIIKNNTDLPKIPKEAILHVIQWYRNITLSNGEEAQVNFYHDLKKDYLTLDNGTEIKLKDIPGVHYWSEHLFSYTPIQKNSGTLTSVDKSDPYYDLLNKQIGMYIETHSHNKMEAFASGTDLSNSGNDAIQLVFGRLDTDSVQMHSWVTVREFVREGIFSDELLDYVDMPEFTTKSDLNKKKNAPEGYYKYYIPITELDTVTISNNLLDEWSKQVVIPAPPVVFPKTTSTSLFSGYVNGTVTDYDFWGPGSTKSTKAKSYSYVPYPQKLESVKDLAIDYFDSVLQDTEEFNFVYAMINMWVSGASLASYTMKSEEELLELLIQEIQSNLVLIQSMEMDLEEENSFAK